MGKHSSHAFSYILLAAGYSPHHRPNIHASVRNLTRTNGVGRAWEAFDIIPRAIGGD